MREEEVERERARQLASAARHSQLYEALLTLESCANASEHALAGVCSVVSLCVCVRSPCLMLPPAASRALETEYACAQPVPVHPPHIFTTHELRS